MRTSGTSSAGRCLQVFPPAIEFADFQPGVLHTTIISVKNIDQKVRTLTIKPPKTKHFSLRGVQPSVRLAPGLEVAFEIACHVADGTARDYRDALHVSCEAETVEVPVSATCPKADVVIEGDLSFGVVPMDSSATKQFRLVNRGSLSANYKIEWEKAAMLSVTPMSGTLPPRGSADSAVEVTVQLRVAEPGVASGELSISIGEAKFPTRLPYGATVVKPNYELLTSGTGTQAGQVDFGALYYGEVQEVHYELLNNSPVEAKFTISYGTKDEMSDEAREREQEASIYQEGESESDPHAALLQAARLRAKARASFTNPFTINPPAGSIPAYGRASLVVVFGPKAQREKRGFTGSKANDVAPPRSFDYIMQVEFGSSGHRLRVPCKGRAVQPAVQITPGELQFGNLVTYDYADQLVEVANLSGELAAIVAAEPSSPYFHCLPPKATIRPGQSTSITVRYNPKALGRHSCVMPLKILSPVTHMEVEQLRCTVSGSALRVGSKPALVGGIDKLPEDFAKAPKYIDEAEAVLQALTNEPTFKRQKVWEKPETLGMLETIGAGTRYGLSKFEVMARDTHRGKYDAVLRERRSAKSQRHLYRAIDEQDPNLGMSTRSGLKAPTVELQEGVDPLWTLEKQVVRSPQVRKAVSDDELAALQLLPERPSSDAERVACQKELSPKELAHLVVGPKVIDFGKVSASMAVTQYFTVTNTLASAVHVVLDAKKYTELRASTHTAQVIPPGATAKFPLTLSSTTCKTVHHQVEYCVNAWHFFSFEVNANVMPVSLDLSTTELLFDYSLDSWEPFVDRDVVMDNPNRFPAEYEWVCSNSTFSVTPSKGVLKALTSSEVKVRWAPPHDCPPGVQEGTLMLKLTGGAEPFRRVTLRAELPEGSLRFTDKLLDAGPIPCGVPQSLTVQVRNTGQHESAFRVLASDTLIVSPERGKVGAEDVLDLEVAFTQGQAGPFQTMLELEVRGGKVIKLPIKADVVIPEVEILEDELSMGPVYLDSTSKLSLTLHNVTPVQASLSVDLTKYPEFQLVLPKTAWNPEEYENCPLERVGLFFDGGDRRASNLATPRRSMMESMSRTEKTKTKPTTGYKYRITVRPRSTLPLQLAFKPHEERSHAFELPIMLQTVAANNASKPRKVVSGEGLHPRLLFSLTTIDFNTRIVLRSSTAQTPYKEQIRITNNDCKPIALLFGSPKNHADTYRVEPAELTVDAGEDALLDVIFSPHAAKSYDDELPLFVDGGVTPYMALELAGIAQFPRLSFDVRECVLPAVPLGIRTQALVHIINNGYDNLELKYRMPADESHIPLNLEFPEGTIIGIAKQRLPVLLSCSSPKPLSFTANVDFLDEEGKRYSLPVTATIDNSLFTHQPFMAANIGELLWATKDDQAVMLEETMYALPAIELALGPLDTPNNMSRYLNATTTRGPFNKDIHTQLANSRGKLLLELVELLSGKPVPNKVRLSGSKKAIAEQLVSQYDVVLTHLKGHGALLNAVKPEMLLSVEDFLHVLNAREARAASGAQPQEQESVDHWYEMQLNFEQVSKQAWNTVLLQLFRVFVLSRVTIRSLKSLPAPTPLDLGPDSMFLGSNVYSVGESGLLAWLTGHLAIAFPEAATRITNFDVNLMGSVPLFALLINYWPALSNRRPMIAVHPSSEAEIRSNAAQVMKAMQDIGLPFEVELEDLEKPDATEMLLLLLYLYQTLPQLVPKAAIDFPCRIGEVLAKDVELSNPTKKLISYSARLEGSDDFTLDTSIVRIDPKNAAKLTVRCTPSSGLSREARLVLSSRRDGSAHAATLVFLLRSTINTRAPLKRVRVEVPLYEMQQFDFTVTNPFPTDCEFSITLTHEPAEPVVTQAALESPKRDRKGGSGAAAKKGAKAAPSQADLVSKLAAAQASGPQLYPNAFGLERNRVRLKRNGSEKLKVMFLPFTMGTHYCTVVFSDKERGDFCYELVGETQLPATFMEHKATVGLENTQVVDIPVAFVNHQLEAAKRLFLDKHPLRNVREQVQFIKDEKKTGATMQRDRAYQVSQTNSLIAVHEALNLRIQPVGGTQVIGGAAAAAARGGPAGAPGAPADDGKPTTPGPPQITDPSQLKEPPSSLMLFIKPVGTGLYPARVVLASTQDVRVVDVEVVAQSLGQTFTLEFDCASRQQIVQEIPLVNNSEGQMLVSASCHGRAFSGPQQVAVAANSTAYYRLEFKPASPGEYQATLELSISSTGERNIYHLVGRAGDPVAEGVVVIDCQARKAATKRLAVPNLTGTKGEYKVMTDLEFATGRDSVDVDASGGGNYKLTVSPARSGTFLGSIAFMTSEGLYSWYALEVRASEPPPLGDIKVNARIREALAINIDLSNPLEHPITMKVKYSHDSLVGPKVFQVPAESASTFECYYAPLVLEQQSGTIVMTNDEVGEFCYNVSMQSEPSEAEVVPEMSAELGKRTTVVVAVENPLACEVVLVASSSNPRNFNALPGSVLLPPYGSAQLAIEYSPSSLHQTEQGVVRLSCARLAPWEFSCTGTGQPPSKQLSTDVVATLGSTTTAAVAWVNPFPEQAQVNVTLVTAERVGVFEVLLRRDGGSRVSVAPLGTLQIPVSFKPHHLNVFSAELQVSLDSSASREPLVWRYPVNGVAELSSKAAVFRYRCKARSTIEERLEIVLTGLSKLSADEEFSHAVVCPPEHRALVDASLKIVPVDTQITRPDQPLVYKVVFAPTKMFSMVVEFEVHKSSGGRWRFELHLAATEPDTDGELLVEAHMGYTEQVPVLLYSCSDQPEPFNASFSPDTPLTFNTQPAKGFLPPRPKEGEPEPEPPMYVTYTCKELGKTVRGRLFVHTSDTHYSFEVRGRQPQYVPPDVTRLSSRLDNQLPQSTLRGLSSEQAQRKNHIGDNIRAAKAKSRQSTPAANATR